MSAFVFRSKINEYQSSPDDFWYIYLCPVFVQAVITIFYWVVHAIENRIKRKVETHKVIKRFSIDEFLS